MDEESFNQGHGICFLCKYLIFPQEDAFFHYAPFHVECLMKLDDQFYRLLDPDPTFFYNWLSFCYDGRFTTNVDDNERFVVVPDPDWPLDDPNIHVIDDADWPDDPDPEWEAAEAEYENVSGDGVLTVLLLNQWGHGIGVYGNLPPGEEEMAESDVLETVSNGGEEEVIVISDDDGDATEVSAEEATEGSETERTEGEDGEDA